MFGAMAFHQLAIIPTNSTNQTYRLPLGQPTLVFPHPISQVSSSFEKTKFILTDRQNTTKLRWKNFKHFD
jgi:hypothetical protein